MKKGVDERIEESVFQWFGYIERMETRMIERIIERLETRMMVLNGEAGLECEVHVAGGSFGACL